MLRLRHLAVLAASSALVFLPTATPAQEFGDASDIASGGEPSTSEIDRGFGTAHSASPQARAEARRAEQLTADGDARNDEDDYDPYEPKPKPWFLEDSVREELGLRDPDLGPLYQDYDAVWQRHKMRQAKLEAGKTGTEKAIEEQAELRKEIRANWDRDVAEYQRGYLDDDQYNRYTQLRNQYYGVNRFADPAYARDFGLTPVQTNDISGLRDDYNRRLRDLNNYEGSLEDRQAEFDRLRQDTSDALNRILTPEQRQQMSQLNGDPFNFRADNFVGSAPDLENQPSALNGNRNPNTYQSGANNPTSGVGTGGNAPTGSGVGVPQPSTPATGGGNIGSGGPGGTAGDLDSPSGSTSGGSSGSGGN